MEAALQLLAQRQEVADGHKAALSATQRFEVALWPAGLAVLLRKDGQRCPLLVDFDGPAPLA